MGPTPPIARLKAPGVASVVPGKPSTAICSGLPVLRGLAHALAKAAFLRIRIEEKQRKLVRQDDVNELIDQIAGITLTHLSGMRRVAAATSW